MKMVEISQATGTLAQYAHDMNGESIVLTENGKPVAALVSVQNTDWETIKLSLDPRFMQIIEDSRDAHKQNGGVSPDEMRRRLGTG